jgi:hypothetical protein
MSPLRMAHIIVCASGFGKVWNLWENTLNKLSTLQEKDAQPLDVT